MDRKTGLANWASNFEVNATSGAGNAGTQNSATSLAGDSAGANPPFMALTFIIRTG